MEIKETHDGKSDQFPHKCTRCGICCLLQLCRHAQKMISILSIEYKPGTPCGFLRYDLRDGLSTCTLAHQLHAIPGAQWDDIKAAFGFDAGCCISGAAISPSGKAYDIASLSPAQKKHLAHYIRAGVIERAEVRPNDN